jgi:uncharacterized protein (DUF1810 family)
VDDPYDLDRFLQAQEPIYEQVLRELRAGRKASHWMWFIFPQIAGLGYSPMAQRYAIANRDEAAAYAGHFVLSERLRECTGLVNAVESRTLREIFGSPDDLKFRSCMTLFSWCAGDPQIFRDALDKYFDGKEDELTVARLE